MATGCSPDDVTSVCSVCLEPYNGRNPKILPCFHTFCLPCLKDLELNHTNRSEHTQISEEDEGDQKPITFPCPVCRSLITVPPGGVIQFQTNFYLSDKTLICEVCDRGEEAMCSCAECGHKMCSQCQRCHDKFLSSHHVQPLTSKCTQSSQNILDTDCERKLDEHLEVLEATLATIRGEQDTLQRERQAVADVISKRADAVRALVTQAEDRSQRALAKVAERLGKQLQEEKAIARAMCGRIWQLSTERAKGLTPLTLRATRTVLLTDDDFQYYQQRPSRGGEMKIKLHQFDDLAIDLQAIESYIGTVCSDPQPARETSDVLVAASLSRQRPMAENPEGDVSVTLPSSDTTRLIQDVADKIQTLEALIESVCKPLEKVDIKSVEDKISKLQLEVVPLKEEDTKVQKYLVTLKEDISSIRNEMINIQDKLMVTTSKLQKDIDSIQQNASVLEKESRKFQDDLSLDIKSFKEKSCSMVAFHANLTRDIEISKYWQPLILNADEYNEGQAYDTKTGVFTAPVAGTYFFMARALRKEGPGFCALDIRGTGSKDVLSRSHYGELQAGVGCTVHVVQRLTQGQTVSLVAGGDTTLSSLRTCFSGMLVRPEVELA